MARGALMERLGLTSAEAAGQLADLSAATGIPLAEMAAAVLSHASSGSHPGPESGPRPEPGPEPGDDLRHTAGAGPAPLRAEAAAELAADGAELAGTLAAQVLDPLGATAVALWLLEPDGALTLLGEHGLSHGEASHWRHIPPQLDCPAQ